MLLLLVLHILAKIDGKPLNADNWDDYYTQALEDVTPPIVTLDSDDLEDYKITSPNPNWTTGEAQGNTDDWIKGLDLSDFEGVETALAQNIIDSKIGSIITDYGFSAFKLVPTDGGYLIRQTFPAGFISKENGENFVLTYRDKSQDVVSVPVTVEEVKVEEKLIAVETVIESVTSVMKSSVEAARLRMEAENRGEIVSTGPGINEHLYTGGFVNTVKAFDGVSDDQAFAAIDAIVEAYEVSESVDAKKLREASESRGEAVETKVGVNEHLYTNDFVNTIEAFNSVSDAEAFQAIDAIILDIEIDNKIKSGDTPGLIDTIIKNVTDVFKAEEQDVEENTYSEFDTIEYYEAYQEELQNNSKKQGFAPIVYTDHQVEIALRNTATIESYLTENGKNKLTDEQRKLLSITPQYILDNEEEDLNSDRFIGMTNTQKAVEVTTDILKAVSDFVIKPAHGDFIEEAVVTPFDTTEDSLASDAGVITDKSGNPVGGDRSGPEQTYTEAEVTEAVKVFNKNGRKDFAPVATTAKEKAIMGEPVVIKENTPLKRVFDSKRKQGFAPLQEEVSVRDVLDFIPVVGDVLAGKDVIDELNKEDTDWRKVGILSGVAVIGLIPGIGDAVAKTIKVGSYKLLAGASVVGRVTANSDKSMVAARELAEKLDGPIPVDKDRFVLKNGVIFKATVDTVKGKIRSEVVDTIVDTGEDLLKKVEKEVAATPRPMREDFSKGPKGTAEYKLAMKAFNKNK